MTDPAPSPFELATAELRKLGITLRQLPGEYTVNFRNGSDATARNADTLDEAVELGRSRPRGRRAATPPTPAHDAEGSQPTPAHGAQPATSGTRDPEHQGKTEYGVAVGPVKPRSQNCKDQRARPQAEFRHHRRECRRFAASIESAVEPRATER
jgi:hypothetical protein